MSRRLPSRTEQLLDGGRELAARCHVGIFERTFNQGISNAVSPGGLGPSHKSRRSRVRTHRDTPARQSSEGGRCERP